MNLRDKLRSGGTPDDTSTSEDAWGSPADLPEAEAPRKSAKAAPKASAKVLPKLDVNRRFMMLAGAAAFLTALHIRGENAAVLLGFVAVLREHMIPIELEGIPAIDLCGTGGDGQHTVNLSTAAALVVAGAGVRAFARGCHGRPESMQVLH